MVFFFVKSLVSTGKGGPNDPNTFKIFAIYTEKVNIHYPGNCFFRSFRGSASWESSYDHNIRGNKPGFPITKEFLEPRYILGSGGIESEGIPIGQWS
jgi:hypothetical protein